jgi:hypothetical protein
MVNGLSQYDTNIAFKFHNFVQMTLYHQCDQFCNTFIYLNQYVGHDILNMDFIYFLNVLLFHGLGYYHNMMRVLFSFYVLIW